MQNVIEQQLKHNDCGISAVKMIYNLHKVNINKKYIEENIYLNETGSSLHDIKDFFEKEGFDSQFNLLDLNALKFNTQKLKDNIPCIMPVKNSQGYHYVVISSINNKKIQVLDPAKGLVSYWTFSELMNHAHIATANYDLLSNREVIRQIIKEELSAYQLDLPDIDTLDSADLLNKLTYFSYVKENFGFTNKDAESAFLKDLIFNQQLSTLPKQFRSLKLNQGKLRIKAPVVLTVKKRPESILSTKANVEEEKKVNPYRLLFNKLKPYHGLWFIYIASAIFAALLGQLTIFSNQILIDNVLPDFNINILILFAIGLGIFRLFNLFLSLYKSFIAIHLANVFDNFFLTSFVDKLNNFPIRYIHTYSKGDLTERIKDSLKLKTFFIRFFTNLVIDSFVGVYSLVVLFIIDWQVTFIVLAIVALFTVWFKVITPYIRENEKRRFLEKSNLFSTLFENIEGLQVIKSFRLENLFKQRIAPRVTSILNLQKKVRLISLVNSGVVEFIIITAGILIIVFLSRRAIYTQTISIGQIITYLMLSYQVFGSVSALLAENMDIQENEIILTRYLDFGKSEKTAVTATLHEPIRSFDIERLEFRSVDFHYIPHKPVISGLNMVINKGDKIRLEGRNGTGKSTFCKVLTLLYQPDAGDILINNEKHIFYNSAELRTKILLVTNEDILFNDTIGYNVSFSHSASASEILSLAREVGLYDFIADQNEGLDYVINEQGRNLSTGQRKKILLMRALYSKADIIVMDETLSGIDQQSRGQIEEYINSQVDRSFIVISHEPLYKLKFSKTLIMNNGRIEQLQLQGV